jgi:hypothetical protein
VPKLIAAAESDSDGAVVISVAGALIEMGEEQGYSGLLCRCYWRKKSGQGLIAFQQKISSGKNQVLVKANCRQGTRNGS